MCSIKPEQWCTGSHSWAAYWLDTGHLHRINITAVHSGDICKLWLYQKIMTCKLHVKTGECVARTINQSQTCGKQNAGGENWKLILLQLQLSANLKAKLQVEVACGLVHARDFAGWGVGSGRGGVANILLASKSVKTSVQTFMHSQAFLLRPLKCE